jgi:probable rRNA maturation factor
VTRRPRGGPSTDADSTRTVYRPPWRVDVVRRAGIKSPLPVSGLARLVGAALEAAGAPEPGSVTIVLTDDAELSELNAEHMGVDGTTDVLSFPMLSPESFRRDAAAVGPRKRKPWAPVGRARRTHIGDIAISVERATEQAAIGRGGQTGDVRWSSGDELRLLVTHGTLHLCGWDHQEPNDERAMRRLEGLLLRLPEAEID